MTAENTVYWDPYRTEFWANPHPVFKRLRNEAPLYRNEEYDFYAVSRFSDVERGLIDREHLSSSRGDILEYIKADLPKTKGLFIWEDPPEHTAHRGVLSKVFTPRRMNELEGKIRAYCTRCLDPLVGAGGFDFVKDLGAEMPMRVIGMLLGIPEEDQVGIREMVDASLRTEAGKPLDSSQARNSGQEFAQYIEWRSKHPSSDLMTDLLRAEFQDETGTQRKLTREEILVFVNLLAGAGNETTTRLVGWTGKVLADHPEQRAEIAKDPTLIPNAIEELLRFEPPGPSVARYVAKDFEIQGQTVPAGAALLLLVAAANRDESRYPDGDRFDIHRKGPPHITFGRGIHACLGAALARIEGRVALDEVLKRFPNWSVDLDNAKIGSTSTVRGWETLPVFTGNGSRPSARRAAEPAAAPTVTASPTGSWELNLSTPVGAQVMTAHIVVNGQSFSGTMSSAELTSQEISGAVSGNTLSWTLPLTKPMPIKLGFEATVAGDTLTGEVKFGMFGKGALSGKRI